MIGHHTYILDMLMQKMYIARSGHNHHSIVWLQLTVHFKLVVSLLFGSGVTVDQK